MANSAPPTADIAKRLNRKRFARSQARKAQKACTGSTHLPIPKYKLACRYRENAVLQSIWPARKHFWKPILNRSRCNGRNAVSIKQLSFIDNPVGVLESIREIARAEAVSLDVRVDFDFEYVSDIGAFLLLAEIWPDFANIFSGGGTMTHSVQKVIEAVGLRHSLGMAFPSLSNLDDVWAMPAQRRRAAGRSRSERRYLDVQRYEAVAGRVCDEINRWLGESGAGAELSAVGRNYLSMIVGELLDNAERHSSPKDKDGSWTAAAFMARRIVDGVERYVCHLGFLSLGTTIAESLAQTASEGMRFLLARFLDTQRRAGALQSDDTLITVAALQDGITRDDESTDRDSGGTGFMEFVDSVNMLGFGTEAQFRPQIAIVSGKSCVTMRAPYIKGEPRGELGRKQFFNPTNSPDEPVDGRFVFDLPDKLPGTVISVSFALDQDFYRKVLHGRDSVS